MTEPPNDGERQKWLRIKEKVLLTAGLVLIAAEFVTVGLGWPFHYEFLLAGGMLCGVSIAQGFDRR
jgi:hypothetical protein